MAIVDYSLYNGRWVEEDWFADQMFVEGREDFLEHMRMRHAYT